jgi:hypothetical protein
VAFGDWLEKASKSETWLGRTGFSLQFEWYKFMRSTRRFEELPAEIREEIYRATLGDRVYPMSSLSGTYSFLPYGVARPNGQLAPELGYHSRLFIPRSGDYMLSTEHRYDSAPEDHTFVYAPNLALSAVSSGIRDEFLHFAWVRMRSRFFKLSLFCLATEARVGSAMAYKHLSKVALGFTNEEWFCFFGIYAEYPPFEIDASRCNGYRLQAFGNLNDLHLRFRTPDDGYNGSPWARKLDKVALPRYGGHFYVCYQRTMADWICTFAYPFLIDKCKENRLKVTLTGAVKTDTKEKWEVIFKNKRDHDHDTVLSAILATSEEEL